MFKYLHVLLLVLVLSNNSMGQEASNVAVASDLWIDLDSIDTTNLDFDDQDYASWQAVVDIGDLEGGTEVSLVLDVKAAMRLSFDSFKANCRCNKLKITNKEFGPRKKNPIAVSFKTPVGNPSGKSAVTINFYEGGIENGQISIQYGIANSLFFESQSHDLHSKQATLLVPIYFTAPVAFENLTASWSSSQNEKVSTEVKELNGGCFVELTVPEDRKASFLSGELSVMDSVSEAKHSDNVMLNFVESVTVSPKIIRFSRTQFEDSRSFYKSSAMLQILDRTLIEKKGETQTGDIDISASVDGTQLKVTKHYLANGIWRLKFVGRKSQIESAYKRDAVIAWNVKCRETRVSFTSLISLEGN